MTRAATVAARGFDNHGAQRAAVRYLAAAGAVSLAPLAAFSLGLYS